MDAAQLSGLVERAMVSGNVVDDQETRDIVAIVTRYGVSRSDLVAARTLLQQNVNAYYTAYDPAQREGARRRWDAYYRIDRALNAQATAPAQFAAGVQEAGQAFGDGTVQVVGGVVQIIGGVVGGAIEGTGNAIRQITN